MTEDLMYIPSVSFGKDSTAMFILMLECKELIHSVV
jgi:3'-phosphoadenosine 5'-phosphosulfate sulfotransferase (PAPS reductase)/FAD synthetase